MTLHHSKADWKDTITTGDDFKARKESGSLPGGQVPVLIHEGKTLNESMAILRYVGRKVGYVPTNDYDLWVCDRSVDFFNGHGFTLGPKIFAKDWSDEAKEAFTKNVNGACNHLAKHLPGDKFICGDKITIADMCAAQYFFSFIHNKSFPNQEWAEAGKEILEKFGKVNAYVERLRAELAEHLEKRFSASL